MDRGSFLFPVGEVHRETIRCADGGNIIRSIGRAAQPLRDAISPQPDGVTILDVGTQVVGSVDIVGITLTGRDQRAIGIGSGVRKDFRHAFAVHRRRRQAGDIVVKFHLAQTGILRGIPPVGGDEKFHLAHVVAHEGNVLTAFRGQPAGLVEGVDASAGERTAHRRSHEDFHGLAAAVQIGAAGFVVVPNMDGGQILIRSKIESDVCG